jgi:hypothetical protein
VMAAATDGRAVVVPWGGGTHQGLGRRVYPDVVLATSPLDRIVAWEPEDLTVVVEAGVTWTTWKPSWRPADRPRRSRRRRRSHRRWCHLGGRVRLSATPLRTVPRPDPAGDAGHR